MTSTCAPMTPLVYTITDRVEDLSDTVTLTMMPNGDAIDAPLPGQFTMLWVFGVGEAPISLARIGDDGALIQTIRAVGSVTTAMTNLEVGAEVGVRGPFGSNWPIESANGADVLIVAGGLGLSPVRPLIDHVRAHRGDFAAATLFVGARTPDDLLYTDELTTWHDDPSLDVEIIVDSAGENWTSQVGLITKLIANATLDANQTHVFLCGPEPMMHFGALGVLDQGVPEDQVWLSLERNMHCGVVHCGHCQLGPLFICREGPVVAWPRVSDLITIPER